MPLEGKEFQKSLGQYGEVSADVTPQGELVLEAKIKVDLVAELEKAAKKTNTPIDDQAMAWVKKALGR